MRRQAPMASRKSAPPSGEQPQSKQEPPGLRPGVGSMEIEAKYAILGPLNPAALTSLDLGPYHLFPDGETHHQDVLLDTPAYAITSDGHTLRLRHSEGRVLLTYKGPNAGSDGMHEREEIEIPLEAPASTDYQRWPDEIADRIAP